MSARLHTVSDDTRPAVEVHGLGKTYPGGVEAVRGIDFQVAPGEVFGLLGPNGAGKSTTIGMLTTTIEPTSGSARLAGFDVVRDPIAARAVSSVVFQESVLDKALTGRRNLALHTRLWGIPPSAAASKITELADVFGLSEVISRPVDSYSGGQRRRLEIARALVSEPRVLFLDEPTVGLDTRIRYELLDLISGLRGRTGMTTLLTTHYLDEAERLCDRIAVMHQGAIVAMDRPDALLARLGPELVELRVGKDPDGALATMRARGLAAGDAFAIGPALPSRRLGHPGPPPHLAQHAHPARDPRPAGHPPAVRPGDRPGTGQDHPGSRGRRCRLQHIRHRRHRRPAHPADVYLRGHRRHRRPGHRRAPRAAHRAHPPRPDRARQHGRRHRREPAASRRADGCRMAARQPLPRHRRRCRLVHRSRARIHRIHVRPGRDPRQPDSQPGGIRRAHPRGR